MNNFEITAIKTLSQLNTCGNDMADYVDHVVNEPEFTEFSEELSRAWLKLEEGPNNYYRNYLFALVGLAQSVVSFRTGHSTERDLANALPEAIARLVGLTHSYADHLAATPADAAIYFARPANLGNYKPESLG